MAMNADELRFHTLANHCEQMALGAKPVVGEYGNWALHFHSYSDEPGIAGGGINRMLVDFRNGGKLSVWQGEKQWAFHEGFVVNQENEQYAFTDELRCTIDYVLCECNWAHESDYE
jgi:hypothetical protein